MWKDRDRKKEVVEFGNINSIVKGEKCRKGGWIDQLESVSIGNSVI